MTPRRTSAADATPVNVVLVTMDTHLSAAMGRATVQLRRELPGLSLRVHAASEWTDRPDALEGCLADILLVDGDPLTDITILQDKARILAVMKDGEFHRAPPVRPRNATRWAA